MKNLPFFLPFLFAFLFALLLTALPVGAGHLHQEKEYQGAWCAKAGGVTEYLLDDKTRVDCLTDTLAVEFDFASKWAECIGQALYYGQQTHRQGACVLILENKEKDLKYLKRLQNVADIDGVRLKIFTMDEI